MNIPCFQLTVRARADPSSLKGNTPAHTTLLEAPSMTQLSILQPFQFLL